MIKTKVTLLPIIHPKYFLLIFITKHPFPSQNELNKSYSSLRPSSNDTFGSKILKKEFITSPSVLIPSFSVGEQTLPKIQQFGVLARTALYYEEIITFY